MASVVGNVFANAGEEREANSFRVRVKLRV